MKKILALLCFLPMLALAQAPPLYVRATNGIPYSGNSGVVTVFRTDGTFTNFFGSTDVERGTALKRALSIPAEGYTVYLGSGVFDCGLASLALSNGVSVIGSGRANTIIKEAAFSVNNYHTLQGFTLTNNNGAFIAQKFNGAATYYVGLSVIDVTANAGAAVDNIVLSKYHTNVWFNNVSLRSSGDVVVIPLGSISRWDNCILEGKTSAYQDAVAAMADDRFVLQVFNNVLFSVNATVNNSTVHRATTTNIYNACNFEIKGSGNNFGVIEAVAGANLQFNSCLLTNRATGGTPLDFLVPAGANVYVNAGTVYDRSRVSGTVLPMQGNGEKLWGDDEAYGAGWSDDLTLPTKKRLYAKIETIAGGSGIPTLNGGGTNTSLYSGNDKAILTASYQLLKNDAVALDWNGGTTYEGFTPALNSQTGIALDKIRIASVAYLTNIANASYTKFWPGSTISSNGWEASVIHSVTSTNGGIALTNGAANRVNINDAAAGAGAVKLTGRLLDGATANVSYLDLAGGVPQLVNGFDTVNKVIVGNGVVSITGSGSGAGSPSTISDQDGLTVTTHSSRWLNLIGGIYVGNGGGITNSRVSVAVGYTLAATNFNGFVIVTADAQTLTLPTAVGLADKQVTIKYAVGSGALTIATTSAQTIDGTTPVALTTMQARTYRSDNANWWIVSGYNP